MKRVKLVNRITGLWFRAGAHFTASCVDEATALTPEQAAFVRAMYDGPIAEYDTTALPECDCELCVRDEAVWQPIVRQHHLEEA